MRARRSPISESIGEELSKFINCYNKDVFIDIFNQIVNANGFEQHSKMKIGSSVFKSYTVQYIV